MPASKSRFRQWVVKRLFRWALAFHAILLWALAPLRRKTVLQQDAPRTILLTGTFFSENWIMNHLRPLAMSAECGRATVVSLFPIPATSKVEWIAPPRWLCRLVGETPARLLIFAFTALKRRPDVLGGFHLIPNGLVVSLLAPLIGAKSLYFCGGGPREVLDGGIHGNRALETQRDSDPVAEGRLIGAVNGIDRVICMGNRTVQFYRKRGVTSEFDVIPGGIDSSRFDAAEVDKLYDLIFVGILGQVKRVDLFLEAVALMVGRLPHLKAVIVGTGKLELELKTLAKKLAVDGNVIFAGQQADVASWLRQSRVFVLTSDSEGLSLAMMEALTCGLPCVVSDVGELGEVIQNGINGYLVTGRTGGAFGEALEPLVSNPAQLKHLSAGAVSSAASFELNGTVERWDSILAELSFPTCLHPSTPSSESLVL